MSTNTTSTIGSLGTAVWDWATGDSNSAALARTAAVAYLLNQATSSTNKSNDITNTADQVKVEYSREQIDPSTSNAIPVLYGSGFIGGLLNDAVLADDHMTMWYCITICEKTGVVNSTGQDSRLIFEKIYWNDNEVVFQSDMVTAAALVTEDGSISTDINGLVKIYLYNNGSNDPVRLNDINGGVPAYSIFPNWSPSHTMNNLAFAIIKVTYSAAKSITGIGKLQFKMRNTLYQPGDVLWDYMINNRYGSGLNAEDIHF
jgi:hypothetical protein